MGDRRSGRGVLQMNTTRMGARGQEKAEESRDGGKSGESHSGAERGTEERSPLLLLYAVRELGRIQVTDRYRSVCIVGRQRSPTSRKDEVAR